MYLVVIAAILGQALLLGRVTLLIYTGVFWLIVASLVRFYEEPTLSDRYGERYTAKGTIYHPTRSTTGAFRTKHGLLRNAGD